MSAGSSIREHWRVGCALIPDFAISLLQASLPPAQREGPMALVQSGVHGRVKACDATARGYGIHVGLTANQAWARCPELRCFPWEPEQIKSRNLELAESLRKASPGISPVDHEFGMFWIDARGMRWMGGERGMAETLIELGANAGFEQFRVGIADTLIAARAAAEHTRVAEPIYIVKPGDDVSFIKGLSLDELAIDPTMKDALHGLGLSRVEDLFELPASTLIHRFGPAGIDAIARSRGLDYRRPEETKPPEVMEAVLALDEPVSELPRLIFGLKSMAAQLAGSLRSNGLSADCLMLILRLDDHSEWTEILYPIRPIHHGEAIFELVRDRLEQPGFKSLDSPVVEVRLRTIETSPMSAQQIHLGTERWDATALERIMDRLQGRFGESVIFEAVRCDDARPDEAGCWAPILEVPLNEPDMHPVPAVSYPPGPVRRRFSSPRELRLKLDEDGVPCAIWWSQRWCVVDARGPERMSGQWWNEQVYAYEDYRAVLGRSSVLWIRHDAYGSRWYAMGWLD